MKTPVISYELEGRKMSDAAASLLFWRDAVAKPFDSYDLELGQAYLRRIARLIIASIE